MLVELLRDSAVDSGARSMRRKRSACCAGSKAAALFDGFRGAPAVDLHRLADIIVRLSEFAADQRDNIVEADINPIICSATQ